MVIDQWAQRWGIAAVALQELKGLMGLLPPVATITGQAGSESRQQSLIRIDAANCHVWLTRNNVGALIDSRGVPVRYGLWNESKAQNQAMKSSDLIGIRPVTIRPHHVGHTIGQFVSRECKHQGWQYRGNEHERAQLAFINFINSKGGDAAFASEPGSFNKTEE